MAPNKLNILVYSGNGSTVESVRHVLYTFRRLLAPNYAVIPVTGEMIVKEPWTATCAAFVMPGGADSGYCRTLNGEGNRRIRQWVERGGVYIGFCAGGYYGSSRCEFEVGNRKMEVIGNRELQFFPGTCRGCAFPGFVYHSEEGARAAELKVNKSALGIGSVPDIFKTYYNGGGVFVDAEKYQKDGVEILASYTEKLAVDSGEGTAAVVYRKLGDGATLLTGPHPEFAAVNLDKRADGPGFVKVVDTLADDEKHRMDFLKACLTKLGLEISKEQNVPSLSRIHLSSIRPLDTPELVHSLEQFITTEDEEEYIKGENDTFHIVKPSTWKMGKLMKSLSDSENGVEEKADQSEIAAEDRIVDYNAVTKQVLVHEEDYPGSKETPYFNHHAFYASLQHYQSQNLDESTDFGRHLMYGEVVTSTNTMLEKNTNLLRLLPTGFTFTATVQVAGRGRGSNIWVSPPGSLMFSTVIRHPMSKMQSSPVVFVQYLAAMAVVEGVKSYEGSRYRDMPVKLKWPNDIFALDPNRPNKNKKEYTKIGGILVNAQYNASEYIAVVGVGVNAMNPAPTTSLNALLPFHSSSSSSTNSNNKPPSPPPPFTLERLLSRILTVFESLYTHFIRKGFDKDLEQRYYDNWLHMDQIVTLENEGGVRARIKGITRDYGLLIAEELGWEDRATGKVWQFQSDGNSFDFFKGLVKRKV
ncbi:MAG: hypothetical protein Q9227_002838 [Pyrenula ochraceoflavens]